MVSCALLRSCGFPLRRGMRMFSLKARKVVFPAAFLISFFAVSNVFATHIIHKTFKERVQKAGLIIEGVVASQHSEPSPDSKTVYTYVTFNQLQSIKGEIIEPVKTLRFEGGCMADDCLVVDGMPTFVENEKVILFVRENINDKTICPLVGFSEGKFSIKKDFEGEFVYDGFGNRILGFDSQLELILEKPIVKERPVPIPVQGSPDQLVVPQSNKSADQSFGVLENKFTATIKIILQQSVDNKNDKTDFKKSLNPSKDIEAVSPPEVRP